MRASNVSRIPYYDAATLLLATITATNTASFLFPRAVVAWVPNSVHRNVMNGGTVGRDTGSRRAWSAFGISSSTPDAMTTSTRLLDGKQIDGGYLHGSNACFLPLKQLDMDYRAPRIIRIAGSYPGMTREEFMAVGSDPAPEEGQWSYDFSDPDGPQLGTVALEGSELVNGAADPVVVIAEHFAIGVELPEAITDPVDLVVLVDRTETTFGEREFLVVDVPGKDELTIAGYVSKKDLPEGCEILGRVKLVQIPWLPSMAPTKTGFMEADEYF